MQSWAYTGLCQADLSVRFERAGNVIKPLKYKENAIYEIRPLSLEEIEERAVSIKAFNIQSPHYLIRPSLGIMLCGYYASKSIVGRLTHPYLECEYAGNILELNIASRRFIHSRKGDSIDRLRDLEKLGPAWAFMEFGTCIGD